MEKVFKDVSWVQKEIKEKKAKVVSRPEIVGTTKMVPEGKCYWDLHAVSLLKDAYVAKFIVEFGDGYKQVFEAEDNKASITYAFSGSIGDKFVMKVVAEDNLGNQSDESSLEIELVENQPPTPPIIEGVPKEIPQDSDFKIRISSSKDPEGDEIYYKVYGTGLSFSKTTNISENEEIIVHSPTVTKDTTYSISAVAVDSKGNVSAPVTKKLVVLYNPLKAPVVNMDTTVVNENSTVNGRVVLDDYNGVVISVTANKGEIKDLNQTNGTFKYIAPDIDKSEETDKISAYYTKDGWTSPTTTVDLTIKYVPITGDDGIQDNDIKKNSEQVDN